MMPSRNYNTFPVQAFAQSGHGLLFFKLAPCTVLKRTSSGIRPLSPNLTPEFTVSGLGKSHPDSLGMPELMSSPVTVIQQILLRGAFVTIK